MLGLLYNQPYYDELAKNADTVQGNTDEIVQGKITSLAGQMDNIAVRWKWLTSDVGGGNAFKPLLDGIIAIEDKLMQLKPGNLQLLTTALIGLAAAGPVLWAGGNIISAVGALTGGITALTGLTGV